MKALNTFSRKNYFPRRIEKNELTPTISPLPTLPNVPSLCVAPRSIGKESTTSHQLFLFRLPSVSTTTTTTRGTDGRTLDQWPTGHVTRRPRPMVDGRTPKVSPLSPSSLPRPRSKTFLWGFQPLSSFPSAFPSFLFPLCPVGEVIRQQFNLLSFKRFFFDSSTVF